MIDAPICKRPGCSFRRKKKSGRGERDNHYKATCSDMCKHLLRIATNINEGIRPRGRNASADAAWILGIMETIDSPCRNRLEAIGVETVRDLRIVDQVYKSVWRHL